MALHHLIRLSRRRDRAPERRRTLGATTSSTSPNSDLAQHHLPYRPRIQGGADTRERIGRHREIECFAAAGNRLARGNVRVGSTTYRQMCFMKLAYRFKVAFRVSKEGDAHGSRIHRAWRADGLHHRLLPCRSGSTHAVVGARNERATQAVVRHDSWRTLGIERPSSAIYRTRRRQWPGGYHCQEKSGTAPLWRHEELIPGVVDQSALTASFALARLTRPARRFNLSR